MGQISYLTLYVHYLNQSFQFLCKIYTIIIFILYRGEGVIMYLPKSKKLTHEKVRTETQRFSPHHLNHSVFFKHMA